MSVVLVALCLASFAGFYAEAVEPGWLVNLLDVGAVVLAGLAVSLEGRDA